MARSAGKKKNWGSRSGKLKKLSDLHTIEGQIAKFGFDTSFMESLINGEQLILSALRNTIDKRKIIENNAKSTGHKKIFSTELGSLYKGDCISLLSSMDDESLDCIFADPPFNLSKEYDNGTSDAMKESEYLEWTRTWLELCSKKLKQGGSLFIYNLPKWNTFTANVLNQSLTFRNWIAVDITFSMPISGRLYPSHYALVYYTKGPKPKTFNPPRYPIKSCSKCGKEQNDYGGHKMKLNPKGLNVRDVWTDIPPVRHSKYKNRDANELSLKLLDRILDIATEEGDIVFDPFGGSGTTYIAAEIKNRRWIGVELGDCEPIIERFAGISEEKEFFKKHRANVNVLFTDEALKLRENSGLPVNNFPVTKEQLGRVFGEAFLEQLKNS